MDKGPHNRTFFHDAFLYHRLAYDRPVCNARVPEMRPRTDPAVRSDHRGPFDHCLRLDHCVSPDPDAKVNIAILRIDHGNPLQHQGMIDAPSQDGGSFGKLSAIIDPQGNEAVINQGSEDRVAEQLQKGDESGEIIFTLGIVGGKPGKEAFQ